jgi:hypothetical protein
MTGTAQRSRLNRPRGRGGPEAGVPRRRGIPGVAHTWRAEIRLRRRHHRERIAPQRRLRESWAFWIMERKVGTHLLQEMRRLEERTFGASIMSDTDGQEEEQGKSPNTAAGTRFWEYYFLRYMLGTILGAAIVQILCGNNPFFNQYVSKIVGGASALSITAASVTMVAASGLAYCYIASAPILVLHAARYLLFSFWGIVGAVVSIGILAIATALSLWKPCLWPACVLSLVLIQAIVIVAVLCKKDEFYAFYRDLDLARRRPPESGLVESYRHLCEHANSLFIVVLELLLALVLFHAGKESGSDVVECPCSSHGLFVHWFIFIVWLLPSVAVWSMASFIEYKFSRSPSGTITLP